MLRLVVRFCSEANVATLFHAMWIKVCPVDKATELIPFEHAAKIDTVAHSKRHSERDVNVVRDEQRPPVPKIQNKTLVPGAVVIIRQQSPDESCSLNPGSGIAL